MNKLERENCDRIIFVAEIWGIKNTAISYANKIEQHKLMKERLVGAGAGWGWRGRVG